MRRQSQLPWIYRWRVLGESDKLKVLNNRISRIRRTAFSWWLLILYNGYNTIDTSAGYQKSRLGGRWVALCPTNVEQRHSQTVQFEIENFIDSNFSCCSSSTERSIKVFVVHWHRDVLCRSRMMGLLTPNHYAHGPFPPQFRFQLDTIISVCGASKRSKKDHFKLSTYLSAEISNYSQKLYHFPRFQGVLCVSM